MEPRTRIIETARELSWALSLGILTACIIAAGHAVAQADGDQLSETAADRASFAPVLHHDPRAFDGYTLIAPMTSTRTYLIDMKGFVVNTWHSRYWPGKSCYLLENGHLLRTAMVPPDEHTFGLVTGVGGIIEEFDWDGKLVWTYRMADDTHLAHHDIVRLPSGNILMIVWEKITVEDAIEAGRDPAILHEDGILVDSVIEVRPTPPEGGEIVWRWRVWDHLIQDFDPSKSNYGVVSDHPELIDFNFDEHGHTVSPDSAQALRAIGYLSDTIASDPKNVLRYDWTHINSIAYNAKFDQIMLSPHSFSEIWIIDHSTTTTEAAGHTGGRQGKGGDLLYRWGNPQAYRRGSDEDQQLFLQHSAYWIEDGLEGAGRALIFNNGTTRPDIPHSSVEEIELPVDDNGAYSLGSDGVFGPDRPAWSYSSPDKSEFFAPFVSGAQRLPNGNTLISGGPQGSVFEVTRQKELVWKYTNPVIGVLDPDEVSLDADGNPTVSPGKFNFNRLFQRRFGAPAGSADKVDTRVFRVYRYGPDYPGLVGRDLTPGLPLGEDPASLAN